MSLKEELEAAGLCTTYYLEDGTKITYAVTEALPSMMRSGWTAEGVASPTAAEPYQCVENNGNFLYLTTTNTGNFDMSASHRYYYKTPGEIAVTKTLMPGQEHHTWVEGPLKPDGTRGGLTMRVASIITASSPYGDAGYKVVVDQFWM